VTIADPPGTSTATDDAASMSPTISTHDPLPLLA
jgi:hypothetical protein